MHDRFFMCPVQQIGVGASAHQAALLKQCALERLTTGSEAPPGISTLAKPWEFLAANVQVKIQRQIARVLAKWA
jgi:hypothetical protein